MTQRTITVATANLGRGGAPGEFAENLRRLVNQVPGQHRFFGFQEIDEADAPEEMAQLKRALGKTHRFVGTKTAVPIAVPRTFEIATRSVKKVSDGVAGLSPHRYVVKAVVHPKGKPDDKFADLNTHFARDARRLAEARRDAHAGTKAVVGQTQKSGLAAFLTGDLNAFNYRSLGDDERELVGARLDYIRAYGFSNEHTPEMQLLNTGTVDLTLDGHNCHWAKVRLTW